MLPTTLPPGTIPLENSDHPYSVSTINGVTPLEAIMGIRPGKQLIALPILVQLPRKSLPSNHTHRYTPSLCKIPNLDLLAVAEMHV